MIKSQYKDHLDWKKACPKDYVSAQRQGFLPQICEMMGWPEPQVKRAKWNDELENLRTEYTNKCREIVNEMKIDMDGHFVRGKKAAGVRVRKKAMELRRLTEEFRREFSKLRNEL